MCVNCRFLCAFYVLYYVIINFSLAENLIRTTSCNTVTIPERPTNDVYLSDISLLVCVEHVLVYMQETNPRA